MSLSNMQHPKHYCAGGVYVKELILEHIGDKVLSHAHTYDHLSLVAAGRVRVTVDGESMDYPAKSAVKVAAGKEHMIEALEPNSLWYCIHSVPENLTGEDILDAVVIQPAVQVGQ